MIGLFDSLFFLEGFFPLSFVHWSGWARTMLHEPVTQHQTTFLTITLVTFPFHADTNWKMERSDTYNFSAKRRKLPQSMLCVE